MSAYTLVEMVARGFQSVDRFEIRRPRILTPPQVASLEKQALKISKYLEGQFLGNLGFPTLQHGVVWVLLWEVVGAVVWIMQTGLCGILL
jgi:hypothetical protein